MSIATPSSTTQWQAAEMVRAIESVRRMLDASRPIALEWSPALELLSAIFELSSFEAEVLLVCTAVELDSGIAATLARLQGGECIHLTFGLALSRLREAHWEALAPHAPLRRWNLVSVGDGQTLLTSPLRIDERILHFLVGAEASDPRLDPYITVLSPGLPLVESHQTIADRIERLWQQSTQPIQLAGPDTAAKRAIAVAVGEALNWRTCLWSIDTLPDPAELDRLLRLWQREAALTRSVLVLDAERTGSPSDEIQVERMIARMSERMSGPVFLLVRQRRNSQCPLITFDVARPRFDEQHRIWEQAVEGTAIAATEEIRRVSEHFDFSGEAIQSAAGAWRAAPGTSLWNCCRENARAALDGLAQQITPRAQWDDLILGEDWKRTLRMIAAQVRNRYRVYQEWQLAERGPSGLGITALFAGPSGTGKSLAAEVIASALDLDVCRVDLSQLVSKYIGETEKNISRVCEAAEQSGAVLLFDEADALFGKRSEVKDSHDRHANIEVSYLLQRMEVYRGLAILTTNLADNIDQAFLRRLRFIVHFPLPGAEEREMIWRRMFPAATPLEHVSFKALARLQVTGGNIRNIAVMGMFLAAENGSGVTMPLLLEAAQVEYAKLERNLREFEIEGWI